MRVHMSVINPNNGFVIKSGEFDLSDAVDAGKYQGEQFAAMANGFSVTCIRADLVKTSSPPGGGRSGFDR